MLGVIKLEVYMVHTATPSDTDDLVETIKEHIESISDERVVTSEAQVVIVSED